MKIALDIGAFKPERAHDTDAGLDLKSPVDEIIYPHDSAMIDTGVHVELPRGTVGIIKPRSGLSIWHDVIAGEGVIDEGFSGSIVVKLYNHGSVHYRLTRGDKIAQLVILPVVYPDVEIVEKIEGGERGDNGYGSTGR